MRVFTALLVFLIAASGLPVCRCVDHAGEACRTIGGTAPDSPAAAAAASSCCSGERDASPSRRGGPVSGCCCIDAPESEPSSAPAAGIGSPGEGPFSRAIATFFIAPPPPPAPGGAPLFEHGFGSARASIRSSPDVPLYRLHAALLM